MNLHARLRRARADNKLNHEELEVLKIGNLRAGSSGIMTEDGSVAGSCVRKSHLRSLNIEIEEKTEDKYIMFELGYANEDVMYNQLKATAEENEIILREEEIPISWFTHNGTQVTGRPDIVICEKELSFVPVTLHDGEEVEMEMPGAIPKLALELKSVHSVWIARDVLFNRKPKLSNVIQAAHYMWKLDVPYKLIYKSYSQLGQGMAGTDSWASKLFPRMGEPDSEYIEYNEDKGTIKHIKQFEIVYDLMQDEHGRILYKEEGTGTWTPTIVTIPDIERYFEFTSQIATTGNIGKKPSQVDLLGGKASYKDCDYCELNEICKGVDKKSLGYEEWLRQVQEHSDNLSKEPQVLEEDTDKVITGKPKKKSSFNTGEDK